jgi:hypothetical protein
MSLLNDYSGDVSLECLYVLRSREFLKLDPDKEHGQGTVEATTLTELIML